MSDVNETRKPSGEILVLAREQFTRSISSIRGNVAHLGKKGGVPLDRLENIVFREKPGTRARVMETLISISNQDPRIADMFGHPALAIQSAMQPLVERGDDEVIKTLHNIPPGARMLAVRSSNDYTKAGIDANGILSLPPLLSLGRIFHNTITAGEGQRAVERLFAGWTREKINAALESQRQEVLRPLYISAQPQNVTNENDQSDEPSPGVREHMGLEVLATYLPLPNIVYDSDAYPTLTKEEQVRLGAMAEKFIVKGQRPPIGDSKWAITLNAELPGRLKVIRATTLRKLNINYLTVALQNAQAEIELKPRDKWTELEANAVWKEEQYKAGLHRQTKSPGLISRTTGSHQAWQALLEIDENVAMNVYHRDQAQSRDYGDWLKSQINIK